MKGENEGKFFGRENSIGSQSLKTPQAALSKICSLIIFALMRSDLPHEKSYSSCALPQVAFFATRALLPLFVMLHIQRVGTFRKI